MCEHKMHFMYCTGIHTISAQLMAHDDMLVNEPLVFDKHQQKTLNYL